MSLLHLLHGMGYARIVVCHFNHKLRGHHSDQDQRFVSSVSRRLELKFVTASSNVRDIAAARSLSIETAARQARYDFFQKTALSLRCHDLLLAHHADDQVETLVFNLFRGSGIRGLGAMRTISHYGRLRVIRPLLTTWRKDIDRYVQQHRIQFREDATNAELISVRNTIRHKLLPRIEKLLGRNVKGALLRTATLMADEAAWLEEISASLVQQMGTKARVSDLEALPIAQQRWVLHAWLRAQAVPEPGFETVERVRTLLDRQAPAKVNLPGGSYARRTSGYLWIESAECAAISRATMAAGSDFPVASADPHPPARRGARAGQHREVRRQPACRRRTPDEVSS